MVAASITVSCLFIPYLVNARPNRNNFVTVLFRTGIVWTGSQTLSGLSVHTADVSSWLYSGITINLKGLTYHYKDKMFGLLRRMTAWETITSWDNENLMTVQYKRLSQVTMALTTRQALGSIWNKLQMNTLLLDLTDIHCTFIKKSENYTPYTFSRVKNIDKNI